MHYEEVKKLTPAEKDAFLALIAADPKGTKAPVHWLVTRPVLYAPQATAEEFRSRLIELRDDGEDNPATLIDMLGMNATIALAAATTTYKPHACRCDGYCYHMATG